MTLRARFIPGRLNLEMDALSLERQVLPTEWCLLREVLDLLWGQWDKLLIDLFTTKDNHKIPVYVLPMPDSAAYAGDAMSLDWGHMHMYAVLSKLVRTKEC